jgi:hypothetical protein
MLNIPFRDVEHLANWSILGSMEITPDRIDSIFRALEEQLRAGGTERELVVIGGSALQALGLIRRGTRDVDVLALRESDELRPADPFPPDLARARDRVARDFDLGENWLNPGPTELLRFGLPNGFWERVASRVYGLALTVHFAGRIDQIHFKLYAMVDQGAGRHEADLRALSPTRDELLAAARWAITHDPSEGFRGQLLQALALLGVEDADLES